MVFTLIFNKGPDRITLHNGAAPVFSALVPKSSHTAYIATETWIMYLTWNTVVLSMRESSAKWTFTVDEIEMAGVKGKSLDPSPASPLVEGVKIVAMVLASVAFAVVAGVFVQARIHFDQQQQQQEPKRIVLTELKQGDSLKQGQWLCPTKVWSESECAQLKDCDLMLNGKVIRDLSDSNRMCCSLDFQHDSNLVLSSISGVALKASDTMNAACHSLVIRDNQLELRCKGKTLFFR